VIDRKKLVCISPVRFFPYLGIYRTGCGCGCLIWTSKNRTGPDFQTLFYTDPLDSHAVLVLGPLRLMIKHGRDNSGEPAAISYVAAWFPFHFHHAFQASHISDHLDKMKVILQNSKEIRQRTSKPMKWHFDLDNSQEFWKPVISELWVSSYYVVLPAIILNYL
jgi:hypothetical protein